MKYELCQFIAEATELRNFLVSKNRRQLDSRVSQKTQMSNPSRWIGRCAESDPNIADQNQEPIYSDDQCTSATTSVSSECDTDDCNINNSHLLAIAFGIM